MPSRFAEARPFAFRPPFGLFPSLRCHAGDLATVPLRYENIAVKLEKTVVPAVYGRKIPFSNKMPSSGIKKSRSLFADAIVGTVK